MFVHSSRCQKYHLTILVISLCLRLPAQILDCCFPLLRTIMINSLTPGFLECLVIYILQSICIATNVMKGTEVPNPRRNSACDCTCVLTRIDHCLMTFSCLPCTLFCSCLCKVSDALSQDLCNLSLAFLADFTLSNSIAFTHFIAFSCQLHSVFRFDRKT